MLRQWARLRRKRRKGNIGLNRHCAYNAYMATLTTPATQKYLLPRDANAVGPQNDAERRLYDLIQEGINGGPSQETSIADLSAELRARIRSKR